MGRKPCIAVQALAPAQDPHLHGLFGPLVFVSSLTFPEMIFDFPPDLPMAELASFL